MKDEPVASTRTRTPSPSTVPPPSLRSRPPVSRRSTWPAAGPKRRTRTPSKARKNPATKIPTAKRSFVVEVLPREESSAVIMARITPAENIARVAAENEFRFSDAFLDAIADLLVKLAREEEEQDE